MKCGLGHNSGCAEGVGQWGLGQASSGTCNARLSYPFPRSRASCPATPPWRKDIYRESDPAGELQTPRIIQDLQVVPDTFIGNMNFSFESMIQTFIQ